MSLAPIAGPHRLAALCSTAVLAASLVACSSSGGGGGGSASGAGGATSSSGPAADGVMSAANAARVHSVVVAAQKRPTSIGITEKIKTIATGKKVYYAYFPSPASVITATAMKEAIASVGHGWTVKATQITPTPQGFQSFMNVAIDGGASVIVLSSATESQISAQLAKAKAKHIVVINTDSSTPSDALMTDVKGPEALIQDGTSEADWVLEKTGGKVTPLLLPIEGVEATTLIDQGFTNEWQKMCPKCPKPAVLPLPPTSIGTNMGSLVSAYLAAHRNIGYLVPAFTDAAASMPSALNAAGFSKLRAVTWGQSPSTDSQLVAGKFLDAEIAGPLYEDAWMSVDAALRVLSGQSTSGNGAFCGPDSPVHWDITGPGLKASGVDYTKFYPIVADYQAEFKALWGVS